MTSSDTGELVLIARLLERVPQLPAPALQTDARANTSDGRTPLAARLAVGLILGVLLGFLGLPRLEMPLGIPLARPAAPASVPPAALPEIVSVQDLADTKTDAPRLVPEPTATAPAQPTPPPTLTPTGPLFDMPLNAPIPGWPNDARGTAWFGADGYRLFARDAGQFVATGIPLTQTVRDVTVSASFHKVGGPPGGGYGLILRDQSPSSQRDGHDQSGTYLVFEVGDMGDIGVWQRDQTHWIDIIPWRRAETVHTDLASNTLVVTARGSQLIFQVNGQVVADLNYDKVPLSGGVGLFVGGDLNDVALEQLRIDNTQ